MVNPSGIGYTAGLRAFTAAVLGGIGSIPGAMLGGIIIGLIESLGGQYLAVRWTDVIIFSILIIVTGLRPTGLLGPQSPRASGAAHTGAQFTGLEPPRHIAAPTLFGNTAQPGNSHRRF